MYSGKLWHMLHTSVREGGGCCIVREQCAHVCWVVLLAGWTVAIQRKPPSSFYQAIRQLCCRRELDSILMGHRWVGFKGGGGRGHATEPALCCRRELDSMPTGHRWVCETAECEGGVCGEYAREE